MNHEQIAESLRAAARELEESEARYDGVDHMNEVLSQANNSLAERVKELESYSAGAAKTIDALRAEIENRKESAELLFVDRQVADQKLAAAERRCMDAGARIKDLSKCLENMREEHVRLISEVDQWKKEAADSKSNLQLCIEACDKLKLKIYPREKENYILKTNLQNAQDQRRRLEWDIEGNEIALAAQIAENRRLVEIIAGWLKLSEQWVACTGGQKSGQATFLAGCVKQTEAGC